MQEWLSNHISMASACLGISFQVFTAWTELVRVTIREKNMQQIVPIRLFSLP